MNAVLSVHGNKVANLAKSGTNDYVLSNQRSFDAWGNVRIGSSTGNPTGRYCASIGHKQDDESGLIYMRARYYEPTSGRFVSQDPGMDGFNWYTYSYNSPTNGVDQDGRLTKNPYLLLGAGMLALWGIALTAVALEHIKGAVLASQISQACMYAYAGLWCSTLAIGIGNGGFGDGAVYLLDFAYVAAVTKMLNTVVARCDLLGMTAEASAGTKTMASIAVCATYVYSLTVMSYLVYAFLGG